MTQTNKRAPAQQRPATQQRAAAPQRRAPARPAPRKRAGGMGDLAKLGLIGVIAVAAALVLQCVWPNGFPVARQDKQTGAVVQISEIHSDGPLRINEIMTKNRSTITLDADESPDWIEVMNISSSAVNLGGYTLSKTADDVRTFTFPQMTLEAGECVAVYADSRLRTTAGEDLHAPFRLSSAGDTLMLFNAGGTAIDTVNIPALNADQAYIREDTYTWQTSETPTPALANTQENYLALQQPAGDSPVILTEVMSSNTSTYQSEDGRYYDYIEICNRSGEAVDLGGWYLSDDSTSLRKWRFPSISLGAGECIVIHASKLDRSDDPAHLHTSFGLSSEGETVLLTAPNGRLMDRVDFDLLKNNVSYSRNADGSWSSAAAPSPGKY